MIFSPPFEFNFKPLLAKSGLRNRPPESLPRSWGLKLTGPFDFSLDSSLLGMSTAVMPPRHEAWKPLPHQIPPDSDWFLWLLLGGRGSGKTDAVAHYINEHVEGPACISGYPGGHRVGIVAPTLGDAVESCVNGPSGLKAHNPNVRLTHGLGGAYVRWPSGVEGKLFGAYGPEDVERLRAGGNRCIVWAEEVAAWARLDEVWDHMTFGLRLGPHPRVVGSTTPKPRPKLKELIAHHGTVITAATTDDNPYLAQTVRERLADRYAGTRLGRQELGGEMIEDIEGALFQRAWIEHTRVRQAPQQWRVVVGVDPSGGGNAQGIVVAGIGTDQRGYVFEDRTVSTTPEGWGRAVVRAYHDYRANFVVAEVNYGGDMVTNVIHTVDPNVPVKVVHASRGKAQRAEPVAALVAQGRISHVGSLPMLEDELCTWEPGVSSWSPNRLDAYVWAMTELMIEASRPFGAAVAGERRVISEYRVR